MTIVVGVVLITPIIVLSVGHQLRWRLWLRITRVPQMDQMPITTSGYNLELLPFRFQASLLAVMIFTLSTTQDVSFADKTEGILPRSHT